MVTMEINKQKIYYATYSGMSEERDADGYLDGDPRLTYSKPKELWANVYWPRTDLEQELYGQNLTYERGICVDGYAPEMDEYTIFWIDRIPVLNADGSTDTPHDYVVNRVMRSLNVTNIYLFRQDVKQ